ncbi:hypothetical protein HanXRQr2_Chr04g0188691 [Helianthus annuus]|uniref:Uncharacterized protein n=1 Tax=Helianthus annuus TaxID=4232 RepID=A0A9K3JBV9_HELAN|nr:hypothetical protein HanXRQr2_Chr04g0188691 [Helianthus annuus]
MRGHARVQPNSSSETHFLWFLCVSSNLIRINSPFCFLWFHLNYFSKTAECTFWVSLNQTC